MDFLEFVTRLAWPAVVGGSIYGFREPIKQLLLNIEKLKAKSPFLYLELTRQAQGTLTQATKELEKETQTFKEEVAMTGNAELVAKAEKIEAAVEKVATANNAVTSILFSPESASLRLSQEPVNIRVGKAKE